MKMRLAPQIAALRDSQGRSLWPILGFGVSMIVDYGALYYSFTLLAPAISHDLGWDLSATYGAISAAFFCSGLMAPMTGRLLDRHGGRVVMASGTVVAALAMAALSMAQSWIGFVGALIVAEVAGTAMLYNAAFTTLTQIYGRGARRAITFTTLAAAFSSTLFWPLISSLLGIMDWRGVILVLAALLMIISLPIHLLMPAYSRDQLERAPRADSPDRGADPPVLTGKVRRRAFMLLAISFSLTSFVLASLPLHLIPLLVSLGFSSGTAVLVGACIGPSQFLVRFIEMMVGQRLNAVTIGLVAATLIPVGLVILMLGGAGLAVGLLFAVVYGMGQGLESIAKGIVPLALFGTEGYGALLGKIALLGLFVSAGAPWILSLVREASGPIPALALMAAAGTLAAVAYLGIPRPRHGQPS